MTTDTNQESFFAPLPEGLKLEINAPMNKRSRASIIRHQGRITVYTLAGKVPKPVRLFLTCLNPAAWPEALQLGDELSNAGWTVKLEGLP